MSVFKNESNIDFNFLLNESKKQRDIVFSRGDIDNYDMKKVDYLETIFNLYYDELKSKKTGKIL